MPRSSLARLVPLSLSSRRRWRAEDARTVLDRLASSGLSVGAFAAREGLDAQRLYRWRTQLCTVGKSVPAAFVEINTTTMAPTIEVVVRSRHVVRVRDGFREDTLRRVMAVLEELGSQC